MSKKPIAAYEDMLDQKAKTTYEKDLDKEVDDILKALQYREFEKSILKILVGKNLISISDVKTILGE